MTEKITTVEGQKTAGEYTALANDFDRIATKESNNWLPYYYAAFCNNSERNASDAIPKNC